MIKAMFKAAKIDVVLDRDAEGGLATGQGAIRAQASEHGPIPNNRAPKMRRKV